MSDEQQSVGVLEHYKENKIGYIVFNNQTKFNAVNYEMWCDLPILIEKFSKDQDVRVIVLTGAGEKAFISGADISQFAAKRSGDAAAAYNQLLKMDTLLLPTVKNQRLQRLKGFVWVVD